MKKIPMGYKALLLNQRKRTLIMSVNGDLDEAAGAADATACSTSREGELFTLK
jgi:hypothetical protein